MRFVLFKYLLLDKKPNHILHMNNKIVYFYVTKVVKMANFPENDVWTSHRVSYGETDAMGVVYYANYLHFFERARNEIIRSTGMSYVEVEERGIFLPVREVSCRYRKSLKFDDFAQIRVGIAEWGRASMTFVYEIHDESRKNIYATGFTQHAAVDKNGRPVAIPDWLRDAFNKPQVGILI